MTRALAGLMLCLGLVVNPTLARAYEASTTHPGMTGHAALDSKLHRFLRDLGFEQGLLTRLTVLPERMHKRSYKALHELLQRLPAASGARPDALGASDPTAAERGAARSGRISLPANQPLQQWALGWLMAGSILEGMPNASDLKHFLDADRRRGLHEGRAWRWGMLSTLDRQDSLPTRLFGPSALRWIESPHNPRSLRRWHEHLGQAMASADARARGHHMVLALLALGGVLHVLQDMASPSHTRNDFRGEHLQRLGASALDRGSSYESYVAWRYGRTGLPPFRGTVPDFDRVEHFFSSPQGGGLADITRDAHFSVGTLPRDQRVDRAAVAATLLQRARRSLRYPRPPIEAVDLPCARKRTCYGRGPHGPRYAYRVAEDRLVFFLDYRCLAATARHLVPLAIGFSRGLIDHLLRLRVVLTADAGGLRASWTAALANATVRFYAEDAAGRRRLIVDRPVSGRSAQVSPAEVPAGTTRVYALLRGKSRAGEAIFGVGRGVAPGTAPDRPSSMPSSAPAQAPTPATMPSSAPAAR